MSRIPVVLVSLFLMSCIIPTDPSLPERPNTPPVVEERSEVPMNRFVDIDLAASSGPDGGTSQERFLATVRDPDIEQRLEGLVFIDYNPDSNNRPIAQLDIPPNMSTTRRVEFFVDRTIREISVEGGCRVLELHVSERFVNFAPVVNGDIGKGIWFLRIQQPDQPEPTCERQ